jgi:hypothetical protein
VFAVPWGTAEPRLGITGLDEHRPSRTATRSCSVHQRFKASAILFQIIARQSVYILHTICIILNHSRLRVCVCMCVRVYVCVRACVCVCVCVWKFLTETQSAKTAESYFTRPQFLLNPYRNPWSDKRSTNILNKFKGKGKGTVYPRTGHEGSPRC